ncbi:TolC family protein, partial [Brevundimonas sp.]|uniref:TolC family protein n=1 Tax=Brevundimonas sp. TaxID=1871086 RepID=UPI002FC79A87
MLNRSRVLASAAVISLIVGGLSGPAMAESLRDAVNLAYRTNPTLLAQRANQRALDETTVQARAGLRPNFSVSAGANYQNSDSDRVTTTTGATLLPIDLDGDGVADATGTIPGSTSTVGGTRESDSL